MSACAELFTDLLNSQNYRYEKSVTDSGDTVILFPYKGKEFRLFFCGNEGAYLSLIMLYEKVPEDRVTDAVFACNDINNRYKWVKFCVDKDRYIVVRDDAILSVNSAAEEAFELMLRMIQITDDTKPTIIKAIYA